MKTIFSLLASFGLGASCVLGAPTLKPLKTKFKEPTFVAQAPGETTQLWVLEKAGRILYLDKVTENTELEPVLDITDLIRITMNEQGLLALAFDPKYEENQRFYVYYTGINGDSHLVRYTKKSTAKATKASAEELLNFPQDFKNHNGGFLEFGPDGYLYFGTGDGGSGDDPNNNAQNLNSYLGKILRLDVSGPKSYQIPQDNPFIHNKEAKPEIWAYGLRNPWRASFDPKTKHLFIADVGQNHLEEINRVSLQQGSGANFGWRPREGNAANPNKRLGAELKDAIDPIYSYAHGKADNEGLSVTGGYVYRGPIKSLQGLYFFADYVNPRIWSLDVDRKKDLKLKDWTVQFQHKVAPFSLIASFGVDNSGDLYVVDHGGRLYMLVDDE